MESYITSGQRWRGPEGITEIGMPVISESGGWWVRHESGHAEWLSDEQIDYIAEHWELVSSLGPGEWERRPGMGRFYDRIT